MLTKSNDASGRSQSFNSFSVNEDCKDNYQDPNVTSTKHRFFSLEQASIF